MSPPEPRVMVLCCPGLYWPGGTTPLSPPGLSGSQTSREFDRVLTAVAAFCPAVEAVEPGVCAFGARGPARYFGGETALAGRIIAAVADLGVESRAGVADGLFAAHLAARAAWETSTAWEASTARPVLVIPPGRTPEFLARQPVSVLAGSAAAAGQDGPGLAGWGGAGQGGTGDRAGRDLAALLSRLGLRTLGDLAALPADEIPAGQVSRPVPAGRAGGRFRGGQDAHRLPGQELRCPARRDDQDRAGATSGAGGAGGVGTGGAGGAGGVGADGAGG